MTLKQAWLYLGYTFHYQEVEKILVNLDHVNRYRRKRPKVDAIIFDSALSQTRRSDASEKREEKSVSTFGRFRLWTSFESSPISVNAS